MATAACEFREERAQNRLAHVDDFEPYKQTRFLMAINSKDRVRGDRTEFAVSKNRRFDPGVNYFSVRRISFQKFIYNIDGLSNTFEVAFAVGVPPTNFITKVLQPGVYDEEQLAQVVKDLMDEADTVGSGFTVEVGAFSQTYEITNTNGNWLLRFPQIRLQRIMGYTINVVGANINDTNFAPEPPNLLHPNRMNVNSKFLANALNTFQSDQRSSDLITSIDLAARRFGEVFTVEFADNQLILPFNGRFTAAEIDILLTDEFGQKITLLQGDFFMEVIFFRLSGPPDK